MQSLSKIILALIILVSSASAQSFTQPGTVELGGDISFSSQSSNDGGYNYYPYTANVIFSQTLFSFNPYVGVMLAKGFELGFEPGIEIANPGSSTLINLFVAPSYNFDSKSNLYPYVEFLVGYNSDNEDGTTSGGLGIGGDIGFKLAITGSSLFLFKMEYLSQSYSENIPSFPNRYVNYPSQFKYTVGTLSAGIGFRVFITHAAKTKGTVEKGK